MAKFCGKCGAKLDEDTGLCPNCDIKKRRKAKILLSLLSAGILCCLVFFAFIKFDFIKLNSDAAHFNLLGAGFTDRLVVDESSAVSAAKEAAKILKLGNAADELTVQSVDTVHDTTYYRLQQNHNGIPVAGKTMVVIADPSGNALGFTTNAVPLNKPAFDTPLNPETVRSNLAVYLNGQGYSIEEQDIQLADCSDDKRAYYESDSEMVPVYILPVFLNGAPFSFASAVINAKNGEIIVLDHSIYEETVRVHNPDRTVSVNGYYNQEDSVYQLYDAGSGIKIYSYENKDSDGTDSQSRTFIISENDVFGDTEEEILLEQEKGVTLLYNVSKIADYFTDILNWDGYKTTICCYNDGYYSGKNALGGSFVDEGSDELSGYLSMGSVTGVDALDTMAHEYTHIVSKKIVEWKYIETWSKTPNEAGAINEGYSDIFGEILESYITQAEPDWVHGDRIICNPMSNHYPAAVGDKKFEAFDNNDKWGMYTNTSQSHKTATDYSHGFSTIISHCAYLMNHGVNGTCEAIDLESLAQLWYNTLFTLPSNCTFTVLRENMELTADILGFNEAQKDCIASAFDKVKILKQEDHEETYSTDSTLLILDKNGNAYANCTVQISGKKFWGLLQTGLLKEDYSQELAVSGTDPVDLILPKGNYTITVTDHAAEDQSCQKPVKIRPDGTLTEILIATDFGGDSVIKPLFKPAPSSERDIVLVLDVSGSMSGTSITETKKASANFISTLLNADTRISTVTYDSTASVLSDFTADKNALNDIISDISDICNGGTNIEAGLAEAYSMLSRSTAQKKSIVLMSDGEPNNGKVGDDLIAYANIIKDDDIKIYTLGFFESISSDKSSAQLLMEKIASDGCHYEVANADDLIFSFEDVADQINGQKYIYIRIACPVDVAVRYHGEVLCSAADYLNTRTDFGTLTFEENPEEAEDDLIKILRLKEGADYKIQIVGTGHGFMDYTIGFMDKNGEYRDFRRFKNVKITRKTIISTVAAVSKNTVLNIDENGDGKCDYKLRAERNGYGKKASNHILVYAAGGSGALLILLILLFVIQKRAKN